MKDLKLSKLSVLLCLAAVSILGGCHKKKVAPPPPPPPPPPAPTAHISVSPNAIHAGQTATVTWSTTNASSATISGIGPVADSGSKTVSPSESTTYTLTAKGSGGTAEDSARLTLNTPPPPPPPAPAAPSISEDQLFDQNVKDVFFDYDKYSLRPDDLTVAQTDADFLKQHPDIKVLIAGHCDERGSEEYNIALGQNRAQALQHALVNDGIAASRIRVISYGKEKPFCTESNEACWQQNRRDHITIDK